MTQTVPLVVDLDGTLTPTDTLAESVIKLVKQSPLNLLRMPLWLLRGRSHFKDAVAQQAGISAPYLPYNEALVTYLHEQKASGRRIVLATAAHHSIADAVSRHLGLFDQVIATTPGSNLKGKAKLQAIEQSIGRDFVYAGDSRADLPIWQASTAAILVGVGAKTEARVRRATAVEKSFPRERVGPGTWVRALRVHQWLKNLLLFVPLLTAFSFFDPAKLGTMLLAFAAFSLAASATYIVNDLWDLESDRAHLRKRFRPFARARLSIANGLAAATCLLGIALILARALPAGFFFILLFYVLLTSAYSWILKRYVLIDVLMLSLLYTLRILAGSLAVGITVSSWLMAFSVFIFLSLALIKRCAELVSHEQKGVTNPKGRDYRISDLEVLWPLGVGAALASIVVFGLFINAPETQGSYATPQLLWLVAMGLIYWLARLWIKTSRGEMHDDPVIFAAKDRGSLLTVLGMIAVILSAHYWALPFKM